MALSADGDVAKPQAEPPNEAGQAGNDALPGPASTSPAAAVPPTSQVTEQKFAAWTLQCSTDTSMKPPCQIMYRLASPDQKRVFMVISMARSADNKIGMQMALPLGFAVQEGVKIGFGSKYSTVAKVSRCTTQGCLVEGICPPGMLDVLMKEKSGKVSIRMMQGNVAELPVSLDGFNAAYQAMRAKDG
ncbi:invasion associated locus B family protein [Rhizobium lusitanum]|uniref:Invasion protein IalB n=1 Tax=Rhizobium lusitanum TaxID=293958 RepID=A0A7X0ISC1_9HYPH|nr:invasion associated locus B family protein [Rhizobium lusitanum]MBB6486270.1 invasion protein IalB [Rhizobium lusitanum]